MSPEFLLWSALAILAATLLTLYRVAMGPTVLDRIVGLNVTGTKTIAVVVLIGFLFDRLEFFIDIAFLYALINFVGALAMARFFEGRGVDHAEPPR